MKKSILVSAGPLPLHPEVIKAMSQPMLSHRSRRFATVFGETTDLLAQILHTQNEVFLMPCSGTGCAEAAMVSFFPKGDQIIAVDHGLFSGKYVEMCRSLGLKVIVVSEPWGQPANWERIEAALEAHPYAKALFLVHNETSTGVRSDIAAILAKARAKSPEIVTIVDAVSSAGGMPVETDAWGIDLLFSSTQKALMAPPGLGILSVHPRMWEWYAVSNLPKYYFDLNRVREENRNHMTYTTPAVNVVMGLRRALELLMEEGLEHVYARALTLRDYARQRARDLGCTLLAQDAAASPVVTHFNWPTGVDAEVLRERLEREYDITIAPGLGPFRMCGSRVGHMGYIGMDDLKAAFDAMETLLYELT